MTTTQRTAISGLNTTEEGLTVYDTDTDSFWLWDGSAWVQFIMTDAGWLLSGNTNTTPGTDFIGTTDAQDLVIKTNNTEYLRVKSDGKVGIGTTSPGELLEIFSTSDADLNLTTESSTDVSSIHFNSANDGPSVLTNSGVVGNIWFNGYDGDEYISGARIFSAINGTPSNDFVPSYLGFETNDGTGLYERLIIDYDGQIGVNETSPLELLHITADQDATTSIRLDNSNQGTNVLSTSLEFYDGGTKEAYIGFNNNLDQLIITNDDLGTSNDDIIISSDTDILFQSDGTDVMTIDNSANNVGIGTSTPNSAAVLELSSTSQALVITRMTGTQADAITPIEGMMLYVTSTFGEFASIGFWGYGNSGWEKL